MSNKKVIALVLILVMLWMSFLMFSDTSAFVAWVAYLTGCFSSFILGAGLMVWHTNRKLKQAGFTEVRIKRMLTENKL